VGTSIRDSAERTSSGDSTTVKFEENAAAIRQMLDGMCVNTMVVGERIELGSDADNIRIDVPAARIFVGYGRAARWPSLILRPAARSATSR
jgi:hypothetical protein